MTAKTAKLTLAARAALASKLTLVAKEAGLDLAAKKVVATKAAMAKVKAKKAAIQAKARALSRNGACPRKVVKSGVARKAYPNSYAGKWVAWSPEGRHVVASAKSLKRAMSLALRAGYTRPIMERVPNNLEFVLGKSDS
jgi:hypothetical protein